MTYRGHMMQRQGHPPRGSCRMRAPLQHPQLRLLIDLHQVGFLKPFIAHCPQHSHNHSAGEHQIQNLSVVMLQMLFSNSIGSMHSSRSHVCLHVCHISHASCGLADAVGGVQSCPARQLSQMATLLEKALLSRPAQAAKAGSQQMSWMISHYALRP